jgi:hypothetical protein
MNSCIFIEYHPCWYMKQEKKVLVGSIRCILALAYKAQGQATSDMDLDISS